MSAIAPGSRGTGGAPRAHSRPPRFRVRLLGGVAVLAVLCAACTGPPARDRPAASLHLAWQALALPAPSGTPAEVSDLVACAGRWFAVGSTGAGGDSTGPDAARSPAAWVSSDGQRFTTLPVAPRSVYGRVSRLYAVSCAGTDLAALGAGVGGVHGNPRTAAWRLSAGVLRELPAPFELFGGPDALSVDRVAGGPDGWLVVGGRVIDGRGGADAWHAAPTPSSGEFDPAGLPGTLVSSAGEQTAAADATPLGDGWLVGGATSVLAGSGAGSRRPLAWASGPSGWVRETLPAAGDDAGIDRLTPFGSGILAAGTDGDRFVVWRRAASGHWRGPTTVAAHAGTGSVLPRVRSLSADGTAIALAAGDGRHLRLWTSRDTGRSWRETPVPRVLPDTGEARLSITLRSNRMLLALGSGDSAQLWGAALPS